MSRRDTPYVFGDYDDSEVSELTGDIEEEAGSDVETVIDDGLAMSYRSYRRRRG